MSCSGCRRHGLALCELPAPTWRPLRLSSGKSYFRPNRRVILANLGFRSVRAWRNLLAHIVLRYLRVLEKAYGIGPTAAQRHLADNAGIRGLARRWSRAVMIALAGRVLRLVRAMPEFEPLPRTFYAKPAVVLAQACLGQVLVHQRDDGIIAGRIVEAEAYLGPEDRAAHCYGGRRTARNGVMYGPPGFAYVFFIYGMHVHFNIVAAAAESPAAVLIRAVEPLVGEALMSLRRGQPKQRRLLTNGPGKLCQAFGIAREQNGCDLCRPPLYLSRGTAPHRIRRCQRIGVDYAGSWAKRQLRFVDADSAFLSVRPPTRSSAGY